MDDRDNYVEVVHPSGGRVFEFHRIDLVFCTIKEMYEKLNERCIAALLDHKWLDLVLEGDTYCGVCSCCAYTY